MFMGFITAVKLLNVSHYRVKIKETQAAESRQSHNLSSFSECAGGGSVISDVEGTPEESGIASAINDCLLLGKSCLQWATRAKSSVTGTIMLASTAIVTQPSRLPVSLNLGLNQSFMTVLDPLWSIYFSQPSRHHPVGELCSKWRKCTVSDGSLTPHFKAFYL